MLTDAEALVTAKRVLQLDDAIPAEPDWLAEFGPRLSRLALTVVRENAWQPTTLGGDGSVANEITDARLDGLVFYSARYAGLAADTTWTHFVSAA